MTAAILCPGPSLRALLPSCLRAFDAVIGVNRAPVIVEPLGVRCDWWVFTDWTFLADSGDAIDLSSMPRAWMTTESVLNAAGGKRPAVEAALNAQRARGGRVLFYGELPGGQGEARRLGWTIFSATAALMLAGTSLGASEIDVYGADWSAGGGDADGVTMPGTMRDAERWKCEREVWDQVCAWLGDRGVTVTRHSRHLSITAAAKT